MSAIQLWAVREKLKNYAPAFEELSKHFVMKTYIDKRRRRVYKFICPIGKYSKEIKDFVVVDYNFQIQKNIKILPKYENYYGNFMYITEDKVITRYFVQKIYDNLIFSVEYEFGKYSDICYYFTIEKF